MFIYSTKQIPCQTTLLKSLDVLEGSDSSRQWSVEGVERVWCDDDWSIPVVFIVLILGSILFCPFLAYIAAYSLTY